MREPLEYLCSLIMLSKEGVTKGQLINGWELEFNPIATPTLNETLDARRKQADIDKIYWDMGVLTEDTIRENRFGGEEYSFETDLETSTDASMGMGETTESQNSLEE